MKLSLVTGQNSHMLLYYVILKHKSVFGIIVMLNNEPVTNQMLPRWYCVVAQNMMVLVCVHNSINFNKIQMDLVKMHLSAPPLLLDFSISWEDNFQTLFICCSFLLSFF